MPNFFAQLFERLQSQVTVGVWRQGLQYLLQQLVLGRNARQIQADLLDEAQERFDAQAGRTSAKALARALCEQVDHVMEGPVDRIPLEDRLRIGRELCGATALQLAHAADVLTAYAPYQEAVVRLKRAGKSDSDPELKAARLARNQASQRVRDALLDVGRVAAGDAPRSA